MIVEIESRSNARVKEFIKERDESHCLEGEKLVREVLARRVRLEKLIVRADWQANLRLGEVNAGEIWVVNAAVLAKLSRLKEPAPLIAVLGTDAAGGRLDWRREKIVIALDAVQDPANAGAIFRCASAFGVNAVALCGNSVATTNPKFLRAAQTAFLDVRWQEFADAAKFLRQAEKHGFHVYLTSSHPGGARATFAEVRFPCAILFGNEGGGLAGELFVRYPALAIPHQQRIESLNVAASACIIMYEISRQLQP